MWRNGIAGRAWFLVGLVVALAGAVILIVVNPPCASLVARATSEGIEVVCVQDADVRNLAVLAAAGGVLLSLLILTLFALQRRSAGDAGDQ